MLSVDDAKKLTVPLAIYPSKDEPEEDVCSLICIAATLPNHTIQYNEIVDVIGKKDFASLNDHKYYKDM